MTPVDQTSILQRHLVDQTSGDLTGGIYNDKEQQELTEIDDSFEFKISRTDEKRGNDITMSHKHKKNDNKQVDERGKKTPDLALDNHQTNKLSQPPQSQGKRSQQNLLNKHRATFQDEDNSYQSDVRD